MRFGRVTTSRTHQSGYIKHIKSKIINLHKLNNSNYETVNIIVQFFWSRNACYLFGYFASFGGKKIPELMRGLGKGISEFKKGKNESEEKKKD